MALRTLSLDDLTIDDERSFAHVALQARLKQALRRSGHRFLVPAVAAPISWDLGAVPEPDLLGRPGRRRRVVRGRTSRPTWWRTWPGTTSSAARSRPHRRHGAPPHHRGAVLRRVDRERVRSLSGRPAATNAPESDFITTQVPLMSECAQEAGPVGGGVHDHAGELSRAIRSGRSKICARCCSTRRARSCAAPATPRRPRARRLFGEPLRAAAAPLSAVQLDPVRARLRHQAVCGRPRGRRGGRHAPAGAHLTGLAGRTLDRRRSARCTGVAAPG